MGTELPEGMVPLTPTIQNTSDNSLPDGMVPLQGSAAITSQPSEQPSNGGDPRYKYQREFEPTAIPIDEFGNVAGPEVKLSDPKK